MLGCLLDASFHAVMFTDLHQSASVIVRVGHGCYATATYIGSQLATPPLLLRDDGSVFKDVYPREQPP